MAFAVSARWVARAGEEDRVAAVFEKLAPASRAEPGNILYQLHRDPDDPRVFFIYEQYVDRAAFDAHAASAHFQEHAVGEGIPLLESRERGFYETWDA